MSFLMPVLYFDASTQRDQENDLLQDTRARQERGKYLCCAQCRQRVTALNSAVPINGKHNHHRRNPYGLQFEFQCYAAAPGCEVSGELTSDYSWFAGCRWQYASCHRCQRHLGWYFSGENNFFALIRDQLVVCDENDDKQDNSK